ncbi:MAG: hypothetical protein L3I99_02755 [Sulfurimonas sp.]|nr:hypothetical protein [Sulfurimonas sp.]
MGKQYKTLKDNDIRFIKEQKIFYIASSSGQEVNLAPKGYDTIRVLNDNTLVFLNYPGSGNRTYRDALGDGEFTLVFNSYEKKPMILKIFCKAQIIEEKSSEFYNYLELFKEKESLVRNFFVLNIYAVETSCGHGIPHMEYKEDRELLRKWMHRLDENNELEKYKSDHFTPPNMKNI